MKSDRTIKIWIFGDSFAASKNRYAWARLLDYQVVNRATNGSSQYRIWKAYQKAKADIGPRDKIIFCHTSYSRLYLKNTVTDLMSRWLPTHRFCDIILSDIQYKKESKFIRILKNIWDDVYFYDNYNLLVEDLKRVPNSIHLNFFEDGAYRYVYQNHPGTINHMDQEGNSIIGAQVSKLL
jgi:hypothetical protein